MAFSEKKSMAWQKSLKVVEYNAMYTSRVWTGTIIGIVISNLDIYLTSLA